MNDNPRSWRPGALGWVGLAGVTVLLHGLGRGALGPPPLSSVQRAATWWQRRGPLLATFAAGREILWWLGCYLLAVGPLAGLARWRPSAGLIRRLSQYHLPGAEAMVRVSIGASALGAALFAQTGPSFAASDAAPGGQGGQGGQGDVAPADAPPVLRYVGHAGAVPDGISAVAPPGGRPADGAGGRSGGGSAITPAVPRQGDRSGGKSRSSSAPTAPVRRNVGGRPPATALGPRQGTGEESGDGGRSSSTPRSASGSVARPVPGSSPVASRRPSTTQPGQTAPTSNGAVASARTWTVRPGDSLWSIAESALAAAWGQPADAQELAHYWWRVVEANRASLPIPANPDLLFPGDEVVVPPPPARPGRR